MYITILSWKALSEIEFTNWMWCNIQPLLLLLLPFCALLYSVAYLWQISNICSVNDDFIVHSPRGFISIGLILVVRIRDEFRRNQGRSSGQGRCGRSHKRIILFFDAFPTDTTAVTAWCKWAPSRGRTLSLDVHWIHWMVVMASWA